MRLIDADALADALFDKGKDYPQWVADTIGNMPDAIIRCRDCKYREMSVSPYWDVWCSRLHCGCSYDWFCADGERK